jgi:hemolysin D
MSAVIFPSMSQHWQVFRAALQIENQRDQNALRYHDREFLPAALEIMETPPSPLARALLLSLCGFVVLALAWSFFGRVDVVAVAAGKIIPEARVKIIQWGGSGDGQSGVVRAIHVSEGMSVKAGQLLVELDPTVTRADTAQATRGLLTADMESARAQAITRYLQGKPGGYTAPAGASAALVATQRSLIDSTLAQYEAARASLIQQRRSAEADVQSALAEQSKLTEMLPLLEQQVAARKELAEKGYGSKLTLWQVQEQLIERKKNIAIQQGAIAKARAAIANIDTQLAQLKQQLAKDNYAGLAQAENDAALRTQEITKATQRQSMTRITAPVDGTISQLSLYTIGGVIQAAQPLMTIVPKNSDLIVEAQIQNRDIGFLKKGQLVQVKLEAYPFTDYGLISATLVDISADAVQQPEISQNGSSKESGSGPPQNAGGLNYAARIKLDAKSVARFTSAICKSRGRRAVPLTLKNPKSTDALMCASTVLTPGMAAQADIKTGNRRIISYLLSPISRTTSEAGRER